MRGDELAQCQEELVSILKKVRVGRGLAANMAGTEISIKLARALNLPTDDTLRNEFIRLLIRRRKQFAKVSKTQADLIKTALNLAGEPVEWTRRLQDEANHLGASAKTAGRRVDEAFEAFADVVLAANVGDDEVDPSREKVPLKLLKELLNSRAPS